jgi:hypothetical protein
MCSISEISQDSLDGGLADQKAFTHKTWLKLKFHTYIHAVTEIRNQVPLHEPQNRAGPLINKDPRVQERVVGGDCPERLPAGAIWRQTVQTAYP